jgi:hypothetical protein
MSRLSREFHRLFLPPVPPQDGAPAAVRTLVLEVARPAQWQPLADVWRGVQADLGLPAPAIAVNGRDGLQLWLSLADGVDPADALALLDGLRLRYLAEVPAHRLALRAVPQPEAVPRAAVFDEEQWAAFVAPDLAPLFEDTPWLDLPPPQDGQADLLSRLSSVSPAALAAALQALSPAPAPVGRSLAAGETSLSASTDGTGVAAHEPSPSSAATPAEQAAEQLLLRVVQDEAAPLALRVDAAKALLAGRGGRR